MVKLFLAVTSYQISHKHGVQSSSTSDYPLSIRPNVSELCPSEIWCTHPSSHSADDLDPRVLSRSCVVPALVDWHRGNCHYRPCRREDCCKSHTPVRYACKRWTTSPTWSPAYRTARNPGTTWSAVRRGRRDENVAPRTCRVGDTSPENERRYDAYVSNIIFTNVCNCMIYINSSSCPAWEKRSSIAASASTINIQRSSANQPVFQ